VNRCRELDATDELCLWCRQEDQGEIARGKGVAMSLAATDPPHHRLEEQAGLLSVSVGKVEQILRHRRRVQRCSSRAGVRKGWFTPASHGRRTVTRPRELDRVGASFRKAGTRDYISVQPGLDQLKLLGPPREHPRRTWLGPEWQVLELLAALPDEAGVEAVWRALQ
jgi:hypothetical protein